MPVNSLRRRRLDVVFAAFFFLFAGFLIIPVFRHSVSLLCLYTSRALRALGSRRFPDATGRTRAVSFRLLPWFLPPHPFFIVCPKNKKHVLDFDYFVAKFR